MKQLFDYNFHYNSDKCYKANAGRETNRVTYLTYCGWMREVLTKVSPEK